MKAPIRDVRHIPAEQISSSDRSSSKRSRRTFSKPPKIKGRIRARQAALLKAGRHFLSQYDYDQVSIASISRRADCSVGAFYNRFPAKELWIDAVIDDVFREATNEAESQLAKRWLAEASLQRIVSHLVLLVTTEAERSAGVLRAALKRSLIHPPSLQPVFLYWQAVEGRASELLSGRLRSVNNPKKAVQSAVHLLHALMVHDAVRIGNHSIDVRPRGAILTPPELVHLLSRTLHIQTAKLKT